MPLGVLGQGVRKAFNFVEFARRLMDGTLPVPKKTYPRRSPEQWRADFQYGREQFNALRARGPLKRQGQPDAMVIGKSWDKIKQQNIREKYDMLPDVPDIYQTGEYYVQPRTKLRKDNLERFYWYQKGNRGIQVAENETGRILYNVNPNVRQYLFEHPDVARKLGIDLRKL